MKTIEETIEIIQEDSLIKKYLYPYIWISGSSTRVAPITIWATDWNSHIAILLSTHRNVFKKRIEKIIRMSEGRLTSGIFDSSNDDRPARIIFWYNQ